MKQCSLDNFTEYLDLWLNENCIRSVAIDAKGRVTLSFMDGVKDVFEIIDGDRAQVKRACRHLAEQGIPVKER